MDRKSLTVLAICFVLLLLWSQVVNVIFPPPPNTQRTNLVATATNAEATTNVVEVETSPVSTNAPATPAAITGGSVPTNWANAKEETLVLEAGGLARYTFTSFGGGLKEAELTGYPEVVDCRQKAVAKGGLATLNDHAPLAALISIGDQAMFGDGIFKLALLPDGRGVRAEKTLPDGITVTKVFTASSNYLLTATERVENKSGRPVTLPAHEWVIGTATPMNARDAGLNTMGVFWHNGSKAEHVDENWFANRSLSGCVTGNQPPRSEYRGGASNVFWAAVHNQFFVLAVVPKEPALEIVSRKILLPKPTPEEIAADPKVVREPHGYQTSLVLPAQTIADGTNVERTLSIYAGPKKFETLERLSTLGKDLEVVMGFDRSIAGRFGGFFAKLLLSSMNRIHNLLPISYGWVIIAITVIIKLLFWPLTQASTRSMKKMAALQPQMKALQAKYKADPAKLQQKTMEFWKENKVNPMGGCLPMLLQFPVFIGFYTMIQSAIELRGEHFLWACDLSQPDTVFFIPGLSFIPFLGVPGVGFPVNPLSLFMAVTMWYQSRMTPPSPGMDPMQQKMMKYMPLMFVVMLYNFSAGMTLYWTTQNILTIVQTKLTRAKNPATTGTPAGQPVKPVKKGK